MSKHCTVTRGWMVALVTCTLAACGSNGSAKPDAGPGTVSNTPDARTADADMPFDGIPDAAVPVGLAPSGCELGFDASSGKLALMLSSDVASVRIAVVDGAVQVNDVACTSSDGMPATAANTRQIQVTGTAADDLVLIDISSGNFGKDLLAQQPGISVDLGDGHDEIGLITTSGDDTVLLGTQAGKVLMRFAKDGVQISAANVEGAAVGLGPGNDRVDATGGGALGAPLAVPLKAYGGDGADQLQGGAGNDMLYGGAGNDTFTTAATADGDDLYDGGDDTDVLTYELRHANLVVSIDDLEGDGEAGESDNVLSTVENLIGGHGDDQLSGSAANNEITGGEGNDVLSGGDGDDTFHESGTVQGTDMIYGGSGSDLIDYSGRSGDLRVVVCQPDPPECDSGDCGCLNENGTVDEHDTLVSVENAITGSGNDQLIGDASDNVFVAGAGNDYLEGGAGNDSLYGDDGNDTLLGGAGDDLLYGGNGFDSLDGGDGQGDICIYEPGETAINCELK